MDTFVVKRLRHAYGTGYHYSGLDAIETALANIPLCKNISNRNEMGALGFVPRRHGARSNILASPRLWLIWVRGPGPARGQARPRDPAQA